MYLDNELSYWSENKKVTNLDQISEDKNLYK